MAYQRYTFRPLKLTQRAPGQPAVVTDVHRGTIVEEYGPSTAKTNPLTNQGAADVGFISEPEEPTMHELESKAAVSSWKQIRSSLLSVATENEGFRRDQKCQCNEMAVLRCIRCGSNAYFCENCFLAHHRYFNTFHIAELWEKDHFVPYKYDCFIDPRPFHDCEQKKHSLLSCIDDYGIEHSITVVSCGCEPLAVTLVRARLWPATPQFPRYAFTFELLDWAEALLLECQVSLRDFCNALYFKCRLYQAKRRDMYRCLIDAFEEYRYMKHEMRHMGYLLSFLDSGNQCPACPKSGGKVVLSMDALFGLPRKKSAGESYRSSLHGELFFYNQADVDMFVSDSERVKPSYECSDFLAGGIRSSVRYKALDETALFGYGCRHEFPGRFMNLKHGERLCYGVWMLDKITEAYPDSDVYVMYDIACTMMKHMKLLNKHQVLNNVHLCLPTFHCYGHKVSCQILFGPRRCEGIGLSDGEGMERLWSYLRRFGRMTKEMRPSHREDILAHALTYYGSKSKAKLAKLIRMRWERARNTMMITEETVSTLMPDIDRTLAEDAIKVWIATEKETCFRPPITDDRMTVAWQMDYVQTLLCYEEMQRVSIDEDVSERRSEISRLERKLLDTEKKHKLPLRWLSSDEIVQKQKKLLAKNKQKQLLSSLWASSTKRLFLLKLKVKYADGQKIAKKLSKQIAKEMKVVKALVQEYNSDCDDIADCIQLSDALDAAALGHRLEQVGMTSSHRLSCGRKREAIDAYLVFLRSKEEVAMLEEDAMNCFKYYKEREEVISQEIDVVSGADPFEVGKKAMLHNMFRDNCFLLSKIEQVLSVMKSGHTTAYCHSDTDTSEDDTDSE